jgi:hypothetical protein
MKGKLTIERRRTTLALLKKLRGDEHFQDSIYENSVRTSQETHYVSAGLERVTFGQCLSPFSSEYFVFHLASKISEKKITAGS